MKDKSTDLQQLILLSQAMLKQAQSGSWDEVSSLETMRRERVEAFFMEPIQPEWAPLVSEGIKSMLLINQDIMELGRAEKLELEQVLRQVEQGKKAVKAYSS